MHDSSPYPPEALGYPVFQPYGKSYWVIPFSPYLESIKEQLHTRSIMFTEEYDGLILSSPYSLQEFHDLLKETNEYSTVTLPSSAPIDPVFHHLPVLSLLEFLVQFGTRSWYFHVDSFGCTQNQAEGANIMVFLTRLGGIATTRAEQADVYIINSCAVKKQTEDRMIYLAKTSANAHEVLVVSGCLPLINPKRLQAVNNRIRVSSPNPVPSLLFSLINSRKQHASRKEIAEAPPLEPVYHDRYQLAAIIPVGQGCLGSCTFCAVKFARGRMHSYDLDKLLHYAQSSLQHGAKELWITGQDTASYGVDKKEYSLMDLLQRLIQLPGDFKIRVGMMNPDTLLPHLQEMIEILHHPKMYKFLHLPIQSGSNRILKLMNRNYTVQEYEQIVRRLRSHHPDLTLATDVIVGFPQETREDNEKTIRIIHELEFDITNISRYMDRPGTKSSRMSGKIPSHEMQYRSRLVTEAVNQASLQRNKYWLNWEGDVLIGSTGPHHNFIGRNYAYKPVIVSTGEIGRYATVRVQAVTHTCLLTDPLQFPQNTPLFATM